jgi:hypothetical protein
MERERGLVTGKSYLRRRGVVERVPTGNAAEYQCGTSIHDLISIHT